MVDVDGAWFHSYQGPGAEVKEHLSCTPRQALVSTARQESHLTITCGTIDHYQRLVRVSSSSRHHYHTGSLVVHKRQYVSALAPSPSLLRIPNITLTQPPQQQDVAANQRSLPSLLRRARHHRGAYPPSQPYQTCSSPRLLLLKTALQHAMYY
jgi:hypothetical protein